MKKFDYHTISMNVDPRYCLLMDDPRVHPKPFRLTKGIRTDNECQPGAKYPMSREHPGMGVPDCVNNAFGLFMISAKLKALLEAEAGLEAEFIPIVILNHKGRVASNEHVIANPIGSIDCVNAKATVGSKSDLPPGTYHSIAKLVLDPERIPADRRLFRISARPRIIVIRDDLKQVFAAAGITGMCIQKTGTDIDA